ncbi:MAG: NAD(P)-dependent oxidoreductase [Minisyncoccia bacterium]
MKIMFFGLKKDKQSIFEGSFSDAKVSFFEEKLEENNVALAKDADVVSVFIDSTVDKNIIDTLPNLKFITTRSTGYDHIDYEYAKTKGIQVSNVPVYGSETVAEFTFALLLTLSRKIREATSALKENGNYSTPKNAQGFDLEKKTIGVVGTGKIGKNVIRIARGFNMNVLAYDLYPDTNFAKENGFIYKTLEEVLSESDIITLHAPYTKENHHLINKGNISLLKKGAYLVNTARGELIETEALVNALRDGIIAGAGLDVLEGEKGFKKGDSIPMLEMPNVVMTPHVAFDTREAEARILQTTLENIQKFISNSPVNLVN